MMPGFEPPSSGQKLDFSETAYAGLEVTMDAITLADLLDIQDLADATLAGNEPGAAARQMFVKFAKALESWNVTKGGVPVPATLEGVLAQDAVFITAIVQAWQQGMAQAPPPLHGGSSSGGSSAAESTLGLGAASRSPQSF
jgi:hypothetical protein